MTDREVFEKLQEARDYLSEHFIQGRYGNSKGGVCSIGAVKRAFIGDANGILHNKLDPGLVNAVIGVLNQLSRLAGEYLVEHDDRATTLPGVFNNVQPGVFNNVVVVNDDHGYHPAMLVFDNALREWKSALDRFLPIQEAEPIVVESKEEDLVLV